LIINFSLSNQSTAKCFLTFILECFRFIWEIFPIQSSEMSVFITTMQNMFIKFCSVCQFLGKLSLCILLLLLRCIFCVTYKAWQTFRDYFVHRHTSLIFCCRRVSHFHFRSITPFFFFSPILPKIVHIVPNNKIKATFDICMTFTLLVQQLGYNKLIPGLSSPPTPVFYAWPVFFYFGKNESL